MTAAETALATLITDEQSAWRLANVFAESFLADQVAVSLVDAGGDGWRLSLHFRAAPDEDTFTRRLLGSLGSYPAYFARLAEVNRRGPALVAGTPGLARLTAFVTPRDLPMSSDERG